MGMFERINRNAGSERRPENVPGFKDETPVKKRGTAFGRAVRGADGKIERVMSQEESDARLEQEHSDEKLGELELRLEGIVTMASADRHPDDTRVIEDLQKDIDERRAELGLPLKYSKEN